MPNQLEQRITGLNKRITGLNKRITDLNKKIKTTKEQIEKLETATNISNEVLINVLKSELKELEKNFGNLSLRQKNLEKQQKELAAAKARAAAGAAAEEAAVAVATEEVAAATAGTTAEAEEKAEEKEEEEEVDGAEAKAKAMQELIKKLKSIEKNSNDKMTKVLLAIKEHADTSKQEDWSRAMELTNGRYWSKKEGTDLTVQLKNLDLIEVNNSQALWKTSVYLKWLLPEYDKINMKEEEMQKYIVSSIFSQDTVNSIKEKIKNKANSCCDLMGKQGQDQSKMLGTAIQMGMIGGMNMGKYTKQWVTHHSLQYPSNDDKGSFDKNSNIGGRLVDGKMVDQRKVSQLSAVEHEVNANFRDLDLVEVTTVTERRLYTDILLSHSLDNKQICPALYMFLSNKEKFDINRVDIHLDILDILRFPQNNITGGDKLNEFKKQINDETNYKTKFFGLLALLNLSEHNFNENKENENKVMLTNDLNEIDDNNGSWEDRCNDMQAKLLYAEELIKLKNNHSLLLANQLIEHLKSVQKDTIDYAILVKNIKYISICCSKAEINTNHPQDEKMRASLVKAAFESAKKNSDTTIQKQVFASSQKIFNELSKNLSVKDKCILRVETERLKRPYINPKVFYVIAGALAVAAIAAVAIYATPAIVAAIVVPKVAAQVVAGIASVMTGISIFTLLNYTASCFNTRNMNKQTLVSHTSNNATPLRAHQSGGRGGQSSTDISIPHAYHPGGREDQSSKILYDNFCNGAGAGARANTREGSFSP